MKQNRLPRWGLLIIGGLLASCAHGKSEFEKRPLGRSSSNEPWKGVAITTGGVMAAVRDGGPAEPMRVSCEPWPKDRKEGSTTPFEENASGWKIHARGVGDLIPGNPIPDSALHIEGKSRVEIFDDGFGKVSEEEAMRRGYIDQTGFRIIRFQKLGLRARVTLKNRLFALYPGRSLRTAEGTGVGSTLKELQEAHGKVNMTIFPEPYECAISIPGYNALTFLFRDCDWACGNQGALEVYIGGYDGEEEELPWGE